MHIYIHIHTNTYMYAECDGCEPRLARPSAPKMLGEKCIEVPNMTVTNRRLQAWNNDVHVYTCVYVFNLPNMYVCMYSIYPIYICVCVYVFNLPNIYMCVCIQSETMMYMYLCVCIYSTYVWMHACMYIFVCMYTYIHTYIHT